MSAAAIFLQVLAISGLLISALGLEACVKHRPVELTLNPANIPADGESEAVLTVRNLAGATPLFPALKSCRRRKLGRTGVTGFELVFFPAGSGFELSLPMRH